MRFGYNTNGALGYPLEGAIALLHSYGYESIAITLDHHTLNPFSADLRTQARRIRLSLAHCQMHSVIETGSRFLLNPAHKHHPTLVSPDPAERQFRIQYLKRAIEIAAELESDCVSLWSGTVDSAKNEDAAVAWNWLCDGLHEVCQFAATQGVRIGFEPEPGMFIATLGDYFRIRDTLCEPGFLLTLDIGHVVCQREGAILDIVRASRNDLVNVHIEDVPEGRHEHLPLGEGVVNLEESLSALDEIGYQGGVHVELSRHSHAFPELAANSIRILQQVRK
jgi:L-ribulose-5-phosphate 3-epimerase